MNKREVFYSYKYYVTVSKSHMLFNIKNDKNIILDDLVNIRIIVDVKLIISTSVVIF